MFKRIKSLIAFLTIIPVGIDENCMTEMANSMFLFPLIGTFIGLLTGLFAWILLNMFDSLIVGFLTLGFLLLITGLHHADGLLDFGDGLMYMGSPEEKIRVMRDQQTGVGGIGLSLITFITTALCIARLNQHLIIQSLVVCESSAKFAMVFMAWLGRSAQKGLNTYVINAMHGKYRNLRLLSALLITLGTALPLMGAAGLIPIIASMVTALIIVEVSNMHFKGLTGDVFGAGNELARLSSLLAIVGMSRWMQLH
jgi:adenosylcobinamide-GDP ribazoletransferase